MIINRQVAAIFRMGETFITRQLAPIGLSSGPAYFVLELAASGSLNLTELSRRIGVDRAHTTRMARGLVEKGLATRAPDPADGRGSLLTLTPKGREAATHAERAIVAWIDVISAGVEPQDLAATARAFNSFHVNAMAKLGARGTPPV